MTYDMCIHDIERRVPGSRQRSDVVAVHKSTYIRLGFIGVNEMNQASHHVVVVGAGFGGLEFTRALAGAPVRITMIDKRNHHLFQPLLYQVATTALATSEIAWPIRHLLRKRKDVTTLLANVSRCRPRRQTRAAR